MLMLSERIQEIAAIATDCNFLLFSVNVESKRYRNNFIKKFIVIIKMLGYLLWESERGKELRHLSKTCTRSCIPWWT